MQKRTILISFTLLFLVFSLFYSGINLKINNNESNTFEKLPKIAKSLTITSPTSETSWEVGTTQRITWICSDDVGVLEIELYKDNSRETYIGTAIATKEYFMWEIPNDLVSNTNYQIKIDEVILNLFNPFTPQFSDDFEIINNNNIDPNSITITNPKSSSSWEKGSAQIITWTTTGSIESVEIKLYKNDIFTKAISLYTDNDGVYSWTVPSSLESGTDYQIKIFKYWNTPINDFSDYFEIYENTGTESITVTSPTSSSSWKAGSTHSITWTSSGNINSVDIDLYKNDIFINAITPYTDNDDVYSWKISNDLEFGSDYKIKVSKYGDESVKDFSAYFEINDDGGSGTDSESITVSNPTSSSSWKVGSSQIITWDSSGDISEVTIDLYNNNDLTQNIKESEANSGNYIWKIPNDLKLGLNYQIKISKYQDTSVYGISEYFELSNYAYIEQDSIKINNPNKLTSWKAGSTQTILWIASENINNVAINLYNDNSFVETIAIITSNDDSYKWEIPTHLNEETTYRIIITDFIDLAIFGMSEFFSITNDIITNNDNNSDDNNETTLTIINPTTNTTWRQGNQSLIQWNFNFDLSNIDTLIIKLYKDEQSVLAIVKEENIQDYYLLLIPETIEDGDNYRIYIQIWYATEEIHQHTEFFTISREVSKPNSNNYISGYNLFIFFGIISLISLVLLKKYRI